VCAIEADFIAKMSIAHKEARETCYWQRLLMHGRLASQQEAEALLDEAENIVRIISKILLTSKERYQAKRPDRNDA
jgi:four helix bundle protein